MSISKYIEEFNQKRDELIKKNEEYINANPYPIDELNDLDPESPIAKMYNDNGEIPGSSQFRTSATTQNPDLLKRLDRGNKSLNKIKQNAELASTDANASLKKRYDVVVNGVAGTGLTLSKLLNTEDPDEFEDAYGLILDEAGISGIDASASTVRDAFKELNKSGGSIPAEEKGATAINESEETPTEEKGTSAINEGGVSIAESKEGVPLNPSDIESVEKEADESIVVSSTPTVELEKSISEGAIPEATETGETRETAQFSSINPEEAIESSDATSSIVNNINENITNETTNIQGKSEDIVSSAINEPELTQATPKTESTLETLPKEEVEPRQPEVINETNITEGSTFNEGGTESTSTSEFTTGSEPSVSSAINPPSESASQSGIKLIDFNNDGKISDFEKSLQVSSISNMFGGESSSSNTTINNFEETSSQSINPAISESTISQTESSVGDTTSNIGGSSVTNSQSSINEMMEVANFMKSKREGNSVETNESAVNNKVEVTKSKIGLDRNIAPLTPPKSEEKSSSPSSESVSTSEPVTSSTESSVSESSTETTSTVSNNETNNDNSKTLQSQPIDMSEISIRLRKIENLLSGPLEVKIVE